MSEKAIPEWFKKLVARALTILEEARTGYKNMGFSKRWNALLESYKIKEE